MKTVLIALGGNALIKKGEEETYRNLLANIRKTCKSLVSILKENKVVITTGNGPEIGYIAIQNELAKNKVPQMPLDILGAESQGLIGYPLEEQLLNELRKNKIYKPIVTILTQVLVDKKDQAFKHPTKPIGPFYKTKPKGTNFKQDAKRGFRRFVASPTPLKIIESQIITRLSKDSIVIAAIGGGVPVYEINHQLKGAEAVIDKDKTSALLAKEVKAQELLIITSVPYVCLNYGQKNQKKLKSLSRKEASHYLQQGHFLEGSMKPKIEAAIDFLKYGKRVIITDISNIENAIKGKAGTIITR